LLRGVPHQPRERAPAGRGAREPAAGPDHGHLPVDPDAAVRAVADLARHARGDAPRPRPGRQAGVSRNLAEKLAAQIAAGGPLTVAQYMTACLHDPQFGYYATRPALGEGGDFVTAPLVSQMFGELVGVWAAVSWELMGRPETVRLV